MSVHLDQKECGHFAGEPDLHVVFDAVDRHAVHNFQGRRDDFRSDDPGDRLARGADVPEIGEEGLLFLRRGYQADCDLGDDSQGSLAADEKIAERIAGHIFYAFSAGLKFCAVVKESIERHDVIPGDAILETS